MENWNQTGGVALAAATIDGKVMAIAFMGNGQHLFYRKDILEKALPATFQDVVVIFVTVSGRKSGRLIQEAYAKNILTGGDTSVTDFFAAKTRVPLNGKFLPVVTAATQKVSLASKYNRVASKAAGLGLVSKDDANIEKYVTGKTLDGLYLVIGEEERKIRQDPVGTGSAILKKVFGVFK